VRDVPYKEAEAAEQGSCRVGVSGGYRIRCMVKEGQILPSHDVGGDGPRWGYPKTEKVTEVT
jgi:hypothetical protein